MSAVTAVALQIPILLLLSNSSDVDGFTIVGTHKVSTWPLRPLQGFTPLLYLVCSDDAVKRRGSAGYLRDVLCGAPIQNFDDERYTVVNREGQSVHQDSTIQIYMYMEPHVEVSPVTPCTTRCIAEAQIAWHL